MPYQYSFKAEVGKDEICYFTPNNGESWEEVLCIGVYARLQKDEPVEVYYTINNFPFATDNIISDKKVASKTAFLEWQSRLIDCARDQFKFKGNIDKMFGPESYSNWIPFYKAEMSPSNAYMQGMGLVDFGNEEKS